MTALSTLVCALATASALTAAVPRPAQFREHTVAKDLKLGYQLVAIDVNGDNKIDLIAVDERGTELAWYENPGWERHVIASDVPRTINIDCADVDGDGVPEIAILYRFESSPERSVGIVGMLHHERDVRKPWRLTEIDRVPSAHRVRWADIDGSGHKVMIMAPMVGAKSVAPEYRSLVPIYLYRPGAWKRELLSEELKGVVHSLYPVDWNSDGRQELVTASFAGLTLFRPTKDGHWKSELVAKGTPEACPRCGSSEVQMGRLGLQRFMAVIEPWHGHEVVIYRERPGAWVRRVIDNSFQNGHGLAVGDVDGDGQDEIIAGFRGEGFRLYLFKAVDKIGDFWDRRVLDDGGIAAADCKIRDLNGDGRADVACIGASTGNVKWYENVTPRNRKRRLIPH